MLFDDYALILWSIINFKLKKNNHEKANLIDDCVLPDKRSKLR